MPTGAINQAKAAIAAREASGQTRVEDAGATPDIANQPASPAASATGKLAPAAAAPSMQSVTAMTSLAPGLAATTEVNAVVEASAAFRTFVANAKISGVFQGSPARAFINGRLARAGDVVEPTLGITFEGVDSSRYQLVFRDRTGAIVARKY